MSSSKISIFSGVIVPLIVIAVTVALAFVWSNAEVKSTLFWVNLGYGVVLELVFFGFIATVRAGRREFTGAFYSIMGVCSVYYIAGAVALMLFSGLMPLKFYLTAAVIFTLFWLVVGALIAETDSRHKSDEEVTKEKNRELMKKR